MSAFTIQLQRANEQLSLAVLRIDPLPDREGYEHYELTTGGTSCVISLDTNYWSAPCGHPSQRPFLTSNNAFTNAELRKIAAEIAKHIAYADQQK